jgi:hypothetical protein
MTARHPEIGERVAQRAYARTPENEWKVAGRVEDVVAISDAPCPLLVLERVNDPNYLWSVGLSAEGFWEEFVRIP